ncbi:MULTISPECIES: RNA polymerase sigma factor [Rhodococcus]|uniref:RNA polymerase sigma factor n=1 Tax=Rhodococcus cercidiphylli TaxID=489916 RepID=A0ABU4ASA4_9NOCA|nr:MULTISPECIES: RNA polymerase sigma factor [Rhodococcus]MDV6229071.1 RNA polymerase sigma factor [Rhodococcus cercidiphylli]MDV7987862.1 RNA polymerase sigma factor [Rhodococcus sp. IEGM 1374]
MTDAEVGRALDSVFRAERSILLASLVQLYRDLDLAEEVTSDAIEAALKHWPVDGVPARPGAWLLTTARRKAVDRLRRDQTLAAKVGVLQADTDRTEPSRLNSLDDNLPDDRLQLFFTCAHPALAAGDRLALTLRCLAGLTTGEVARALLVPPATAAQRIVRAKNKIRAARIPFRLPGPDELAGRVPMVLEVIYSIFTEGYSATSGDHVGRIDLTDEALGMGRLLYAALPTESEVIGLLALMLLVDAGRDARTGPDGEIVLSADQDRRLWNAEFIAEGRELVVEALGGGRSGPYALQAAIAALHDESLDADSTDWPQIVALYDVLMTRAPSPIVALNRAVALAMRDGPAAGLHELDLLADEPSLRRYHPYPMARADLLQRLGRFEEAAIDYGQALDFARTAPEKRLLRARLAEVRAYPGQADSTTST